MSCKWEKVKLSELLEFISKGTTPPKGKGFVNKGINYIKSESISYDGQIDNSKFAFIDIDTHIKFKRSQIKEHDILFSMAGAFLGKNAVVTKDLLPANTNQALAILRIDAKKALPKYVSYCLRESNMIQYINSMSAQSAQPNINFKEISSLEISLPTLNEQSEIVKTLGGLDDKIANNNRINQTLEEMAQALFKSWFVDFEPVKAKMEAIAQGTDPQIAAMETISGKTADETQNFASKQYDELRTTADLFPDSLVESELGLIPEGWKINQLYETAEYVNGSSFKSKDFTSDKSGLPIIKIAELKSGIAEQTQYTNVDMPEKYRISNDDMLYSWSGSPETSLEVFKWFGGEGWLNQHIFKINTETKEQKVFVYFLLKYLKPELIATAKNKQTTGLGHITVADMKRILVVVPSLASNPLITKHLISLFEKASNCQKENVVLVKHRDSLLPKLLSGEIELNAD